MNIGKRKTNKTQLIKEHLIAHHTITSWEAIQLYGATRLSAVIYELRNRHGMNIESNNCEHTDRYGNVCQYARYTYLDD